MVNNSEIVYVSGVLFKSEIKELKRKTGQNSIKDAISEAVRFYLDQNDEK